jgi:hypothetical protein
MMILNLRPVDEKLAMTIPGRAALLLRRAVLRG